MITCLNCLSLKQRVTRSRPSDSESKQMVQQSSSTRPSSSSSASSSTRTSAPFFCFTLNEHTIDCLNKYEIDRECKKRHKQIEKELKRSGKMFESTIKLLLLGTGESGKSTILKQMRIIHSNISFTIDERLEKIYYIRANIRDAILSILHSMSSLDIEFECEESLKLDQFVLQHSHLLLNIPLSNEKPASSNNHLDNAANDETLMMMMMKLEEKVWDAIEHLWNHDRSVRLCAKHGHLYHLIDSAEYFLDRISVIRRTDYLPNDQDMLRCRILTTGINETKFQLNRVNFHVFDVGGQRDQRRKWIQCFNQTIIFVVDLSSFNQTLKEDSSMNRLRESLESFRQIWINRYLFHISIILFLNKYDVFVRKIVDEKCKLEDSFPEYNAYKTPEKIDKRFLVTDEHEDVTRAKLFILEQFMNITNENHLMMTKKPCKQQQQQQQQQQQEAKQKSEMQVDENHMNSTTSTTRTTSFNDDNGKYSTTYKYKLDMDNYYFYQNAAQEFNDKFCIPYFTCAIDTDNIKKVFKACSHILKKEHLVKTGLI